MTIILTSVARPRADPNERPLLAWVQKHHIAATNNQADVVDMTTVCVFENISWCSGAD